MPRRSAPVAADVARLVDAGGDEHRVVPLAQLRQGHVAADGAVQVEADAALLEGAPAAQHHLLLQLEVRDAVDHQPAGAVVAVVDVHLVAAGAQPLGGGEAGRAGADDADALREFGARARRRDPAALPGGVGDVLLDRADGDALEALLDDAIALAEPVLRADAAADLGEGVGGGGDLVGLLQPPFRGELQPVRDVVRKRAMDLAEGHAALAAPARLLRRRRRARTRGRSRRSRAARSPTPRFSGCACERRTNCSMRSAMGEVPDRAPWRGTPGGGDPLRQAKPRPLLWCSITAVSERWRALIGR